MIHPPSQACEIGPVAGQAGTLRKPHHHVAGAYRKAFVERSRALEGTTGQYPVRMKRPALPSLGTQFEGQFGDVGDAHAYECPGASEVNGLARV